MGSEGKPLQGKVALVAGATRGASRAVAIELAAAGAFVYATGRSSKATGESEIGRPETIDDTGELINEVGEGKALRVDHLEPTEVEALIAQVQREQGRLDVLVNGIFGGDRYAQFGKKLWDHDLTGGLRMLRMGIDTHLITSHFALPLLMSKPGGIVIELTDGTAEYNENYRSVSGIYYDLVKAAVARLTMAQAYELVDAQCSAIAVTPGWLRSEMMLEIFGVTEQNWRDACEAQPHFCISESPAYVGKAIAALVADPAAITYSGTTVSSGELAKRYDVHDIDGTQPDCWRYLAEVEAKGLPANDEGYR